MTPVEQITRGLVVERGWQPGTHLENQVALRLSHYKLPPGVEQQYSVGKFRLDFAWPEHLVAIEADGWHHRSPEGAAKDAERDAWLRSQGWIILRVDDRGDEQQLRDQVIRAAYVVHAIATASYLRLSGERALADERARAGHKRFSPRDRLD